MTPEQVAFVQSQIANGVTSEQIIQTLLTHSYTEEQANALLQVATGAVPFPVVSSPQTSRLPEISDFFTLVQHRFFSRLNSFIFFVAFSMCSELVLLCFKQVFGSAMSFVITAVVLGVCSVPVSFLISATVLRNLLHSTPQPLVLDATWVLQNSGSIIWVVLLTGCVLVPGFIFLVIPGLILAGYLALAQSVRIVEGVRGFDALIRSTELVRGIWWESFIRVSLVVVPVALLCGFASGVLSFFVGWIPVSNNLIHTFFQSVSGFVMLVVTAEMYVQLSAGQSAFDPVKPTALRTWYPILAGLGVLLVIGVVIVSGATFNALDIINHINTILLN